MGPSASPPLMRRERNRPYVDGGGFEVYAVAGTVRNSEYVGFDRSIANAMRTNQHMNRGLKSRFSWR